MMTKAVVAVAVVAALSGCAAVDDMVADAFCATHSSPYVEHDQCKRMTELSGGYTRGAVVHGLTIGVERGLTAAGDRALRGRPDYSHTLRSRTRDGGVSTTRCDIWDYEHSSFVSCQ